jgi:predicted DsbA family dithiol-disulfide isomerase
MTEGEPFGDPATLVRLASEAGLDADEVRATLASNAYAREVREEESDAAELGIHGVPFFVLGGKYAVSGAQPAETMRLALETAWRELVADEPPVVFAEGAVCGPDGCS